MNTVIICEGCGRRLGCSKGEVFISCSECQGIDLSKVVEIVPEGFCNDCLAGEDVGIRMPRSPARRFKEERKNT